MELDSESQASAATSSSGTQVHSCREESGREDEPESVEEDASTSFSDVLKIMSRTEDSWSEDSWSDESLSQLRELVSRDRDLREGSLDEVLAYLNLWQAQLRRGATSAAEILRAALTTAEPGGLSPIAAIIGQEVQVRDDDEELEHEELRGRQGTYVGFDDSLARSAMTRAHTLASFDVPLAWWQVPSLTAQQ